MKFLKWSDDKWHSLQGSYLLSDKAEHFYLALIGSLTTLFFLPLVTTVLIWIAIGTAWEAKDGLFTYDGKHIQGFSWKDLIADIFGIVAAIIIHTVFTRIVWS